MDTIKEIQRLVNVTCDGIIGSKSIKAISEKLKCDNSIKSIQKAVGVIEDGILGPKTYNAILSKLTDKKENNISYDIIIDAGHTKDNTREYPKDFKNIDWTSGQYKKIADILGFTKDTKNSIEHMLNVAISKATEKVLKEYNVKVLYLDFPEMSNNSEITSVYRKVNELNPKLFLSIHNNAAGTSGWDSLKCKASGTVSCYKAGRENCKKFAKAIADDLIKLRKENNGPHNRADSLSIINVGVLNNCPSHIPATLVEVGFYDNLEDLYWMTTHINKLGKCIADTIFKLIKK